MTGRPRRIPHAHADTATDWGAPSAIFGAAEAEAIVAETGLGLMQGVPVASLAAELSDIGHRLLRHLGAPEPTPPGERKEWATRLAKRLRAVLEEFDADPDSANFHLQAAEAERILLGQDHPAPFPRFPSKPEEQRRLVGQVRATERLLEEVLAPTYPNPFAGTDMPPWFLEHVSLSSTGPRSPIRPGAECIRTTLAGIAFLALRAEIAAEGYARTIRQPKRLPPDRVFFVGLCKEYARAFGRDPGYSTNPATDERRGPTVKFCQAVARQLTAHAPAHIEDPVRGSNAIDLLQKWASEPGTVTEQVRDALAVDMATAVFRRPRAGRAGRGTERDK